MTALECIPKMERLGRYEILDELGRGGMGVVFRAVDPALGRLLAIKTILLPDSDQERLYVTERLLREARAAAVLSHPGIVTVFDVGQENGTVYIVMELIEGHTLEHTLARGQRPEPAWVRDILQQVAGALDYAHGKGVVHRDVKPSNIMIQQDGGAKIMDFGIAKVSASKHLTEAGSMMGTPYYMPPEQVKGERVDGRADQFSLAAIAYELLTGARPFAGDTLTTVLYKVVNSEFRPPQDLNPSLGPEVEKVFRRALATDPAARYATCGEFVSALLAGCEATPGWVVPAQAPLAVAAPSTPTVSTAAPQAATIGLQAPPCRHCGAKLDAGVAFCSQCGTPAPVTRRDATISATVPSAPAVSPFQTVVPPPPLVAAPTTGPQPSAARRGKVRRLLSGKSKTTTSKKPPPAPSSRSAVEGLTYLESAPVPRGFLDSKAFSRTGFFTGDKARCEKVQESLMFYREHLGKQYQTLNRQANITYVLWVGCVALGFLVVAAGLILMFTRGMAQGAVTAVSSTVVFYIQRLFQQREDYYRQSAEEKNAHLEYGNNWLLVIQSVDAIQDPLERARRQARLAGVLTEKLNRGALTTRSAARSTRSGKK